MGTSLVILVVGTFVVLVGCAVFVTLVVLVLTGRLRNRPAFVLPVVLVFAASISNLIVVLRIIRSS